MPDNPTFIPHGPIFQTAYVVDDLDEALRHWTTVLRIGPFFRIDHVPLEHYSFEGKPSTPDLTIALAYSGEVQVELVAQHNDAPSLYLSHLRANGPGFHHVCIRAAGYEAGRASLESAGLTCCSEGRVRNAGRFGYFRPSDPRGLIVEIGEGRPSTQAFFKGIKDASRDWNGLDPVRLAQFPSDEVLAVSPALFARS
ncbi:glyoxalase [Variovorax sp. WS11]|uniref:VOC family protein n=1 Tax=Variovorax sp. WS11 TaxID=1105204 RepID=UPI000D0D1E3A|nr:VOC family protein [Variovorax sp. WS11]NDZ18927.1 VOC family protein [Variovorax sp. WS11]PSL82437.1 glyoxalase [Variovorax sp. WS11]